MNTPSGEKRNPDVIAPEEFPQVRQELSNRAKEYHTKNPESGLGNHTIHYYWRQDNMNIGTERDENNKRPMVMHTKFRIHPGEHNVGGETTMPIPIDELPDFDYAVLKQRMYNSSTPFIDKSKIEFRKPITNLASHKDFHFFSPEVVMLFEGVEDVNFDLLESDIQSSSNMNKLDLRTSSQKGIDQVKKGKNRIIRKKHDLIEIAKDILRMVGEYNHEDDQALRQKTPLQIKEYIDTVAERWAENNPNAGDEISRRVMDRIDDLIDECKQVRAGTNNLEDRSLDVFQDTLSHDGFGFPSSVESPSDAIAEYDVGTSDYLLG